MKTLIRLTAAIAMMFAINNSAFAVLYEGVAGPTAHFEFESETGHLRIFGTGETENHHGSWTYYGAYTAYDSTGNGIDSKYVSGTQYTGSSPIAAYKDKIVSVDIEEGITSIGAAFFYQCTKLTSVSMPSTLKLINYEAFRGCTSLETITIGPNVEKIMGRWATVCEKFRYINVDPANTHFVSVGGVLYTSDLKVLVCFPEALNTIEYVIPEGTVFAATDALYHLRLVQSITIPTTMKDIEYGSFDNCPNLKTLVLKSSTPPTLHKSMVGTQLTGIFVPCGEAATYSNNGNWNSYGGGHIQNAVVVEFYVETSNIELGDVEITSRADCDGYQMTIMAQPTQFGTFAHWDDGNNENPRTIDINKENLAIIYRYKAIFDPKPYTVTLKKLTTGNINGSSVNDKYQVSATKGSDVTTTTGSNLSTSATYHYGDTLNIFCNFSTTGLKFSKWKDGNVDNPRKVIIKGDIVNGVNTYTGVKEYGAEIVGGNVTITTRPNDANFGSTTPAETNVAFGTTVTITASPADKYQLGYWNDDQNNKDLSRNIIATADKEYVAIFEKLKYEITATVNNEIMGSCSGTGIFYVDETTTLVATPKTGYKFVEWEDNHSDNPERTVTVTRNANYSAIFAPIEYPISFYNEDGSFIKTIMTPYNTMAAYSGDLPTKTSTVQWNYTFANWTPALTTVTGPADYTATYTQSLHPYPITFKNDDGTTLATTMVNYGIVPTYNGPTPTKASDAQYTYTHLDWDPALTAVTGDATYTATYSTTLNQYTIRFINGGTELQNSLCDYGSIPSYTGSTPTKAASAQYTYSFSGWDPGITAVTGAKDYNAVFDETINKYTIVFKNDDGETLQSSEVEYGTKPQYIGATPTKAPTVEYTYTFKDWGEEIVNVTGAKTYTATYTETKNKYTVTYKNYDGSVLQSTELEYGATPSYNGDEPQKAEDAQYQYHFSGWSPDEEAVSGNAVYTATFSTTANLHTITFVNWNGETITTKKFEYNTMPEYTGANPTRPATAQYTYTFKGWTPDFVAVTGNKTYTADYIATINKYTIKFVDDDGTELQSSEVEYGSMPEYAGTTPTKDATDQWLYSFNGWDETIVNVTGEKTYTATYSSTLRQYTIAFVDGDGVTIKSDVLDYGVMPTAPATATKTATAEYTYSFKGWDRPILSVSGNATYTALFNSEKNKYTIKFVDGNGTELQSSDIEYGLLPSYVGSDPTKTSDAQYNYSWTHNWAPAITAVTGEATYTAIFNSILRSYTITFVNEDGGELYHNTFNYGETPEYSGNTPTKLPTDEFTYMHSGWDPEIAEVTGEATYTATFSNIKRSYTVTFMNGENKIYSQDFNYGLHPYYDQSQYGVPTKESTVEFNYEFTGWNPAITEETSVTGNITYTAQFKENKRAYTITFKNFADDDEPLYESDFLYGTTPQYNGTQQPEKTDGVNIYEFMGWEPSIVQVTGPATYVAKFASVGAVLYTITFKDYNGRVINTVKYEYNEMPSQPDPMRQQDEHYTYEFAGWDPEIVPVTDDAEYTATYTPTVRQYPITFIDGDGNSTILQVNYGERPTPETPCKTATDEFEYQFSGWQPALENVTGEATYVAQFSQETRKYTITFIDYDGSETRIDVPYRETPSIANPERPADEQFTWSFTGWTPTLAPVSGEATYTAEYTPTLRSYTITVLSSDVAMGVVDGSGTFNYNETANISATAQTGYHFAKWNDENTDNPRKVTVTSNAEFTAMFAANTNTPYTLNIYTQNIENTDYQKETRSMVGTTNQPSAYSAPARAGFTLQDYEPVNINGDGSSVLSIYYNRNSYNLSWNTNGGNELTGSYTSGLVKFGAPITQPAAPERTGFNFMGWENLCTTMPAEDIECIAQWTEMGDTPFNVEHWQQNIDDDNYTLFETVPMTGKANTMTSVAANIYEGFSKERIENCEITEDGLGVAKIYYTRNSYSIRWIVDGTEITENCTNGNVRFGTPITAPADPEKDGYTFVGWGRVVDEQMPAYDIDYVAQWGISDIQYTVNHWLQQLDSLFHMTESETLTGIANTLTEASAKTIEGYTAQEFEQAIIEADGTTTVNIMYLRNSHQLTWNIGEGQIENEAEYTAAGSVWFGTPITAPVLVREGYSYVWNTEIPTEMPDNDFTATAVWTSELHPAIEANYIVQHNQQALDGSFATAATDTLIGIVDSLTAAVAKTFEGFTALEFEQAIIVNESVSPTVVSINYNRNSYKLTWNFDGGTATGNYTNGNVLFGTPIVAPAPTKEGFEFVSWKNLQATMPASDLTCTAVWKEEPLDERISFTVPETISGCEKTRIEATNIEPANIKFSWSVNGVVDESQTDATFIIPDNAPSTGEITVTGTATGSNGQTQSLSYQIQYNIQRQITRTLWDDVITVVNTESMFESYRWYHNGELVDTTEYYNEVGGLTGKYYLVATTHSGVEICSCESDFSAAPEVSMTVFPNPTVDDITVAGNLIETGATISVIDGNGKEWLRKTVETDGSETVRVSQMPQGMYIVKVGDKVVSFIKL